MNSPVFNILYIPDTVDYQSIALVSLLYHSDLRFRLVGNALKPQEAELLQAIANCSDRLEFCHFESDHIIPHGTLLDLLFQYEDAPYFCFADSDIFLFNPLTFDPEIFLRDADVFSAGGRIENDNEAIYAGFKGGATTVSEDGAIALATTFFCAYRRNSLQTLLQHYDVGFEQFRSPQQIPEQVLKLLQQHNIQFEMFDTGKLLGVLYHFNHYKKNHQHIEGLIHLGGMSGRYLQQLDLSQSLVFSDDELEDPESAQAQQFNIRNAYEISLKKLYGKYFYTFLHYVIGKGEKPEVKTQNDKIQQTIQSIENNILQVVEQASQQPDLNDILQLLKTGS